MKDEVRIQDLEENDETNALAKYLKKLAEEDGDSDFRKRFDELWNQSYGKVNHDSSSEGTIKNEL